jgi:hypothetical protein
MRAMKERAREAKCKADEVDVFGSRVESFLVHV